MDMVQISINDLKSFIKNIETMEPRMASGKDKIYCFTTKMGEIIIFAHRNNYPVIF